ncbi:MAG: hypothetical protein ACI89Z_001627 [Porticoccus sp.]
MNEYNGSSDSALVMARTRSSTTTLSPMRRSASILEKVSYVSLSITTFLTGLKIEGNAKLYDHSEALSLFSTQELNLNREGIQIHKKSDLLSDF